MYVLLSQFLKDNMGISETTFWAQIWQLKMKQANSLTDTVYQSSLKNKWITWTDL